MQSTYCTCTFKNFREDFIFAKLSFLKIKPSRNCKITLSFIDIGKSFLSREFVTSLICLLMLHVFAKIKSSRKFPNLQYFILYFQIAFTFGLMITVLIQMFGHVSGGHMNPAVSIAMAAALKISPVRALLYTAAQCVGGIFGSLILKG